jgi:hypothetical protein
MWSKRHKECPKNRSWNRSLDLMYEVDGERVYGKSEI